MKKKILISTKIQNQPRQFAKKCGSGEVQQSLSSALLEKPLRSLLVLQRMQTTG